MQFHSTRMAGQDKPSGVRPLFNHQFNPRIQAFPGASDVADGSIPMRQGYQERNRIQICPGPKRTVYNRLDAALSSMLVAEGSGTLAMMVNLPTN